MKVTDERTVQVLRQIYTEMFTIIILLCAASMMVKILLLEQTFQDCLLEWIIMVGSTFYRMVRALMLVLTLVTGPVDMNDTLKGSASSLIIVVATFGLVALLQPEKFNIKLVISFIIPYVFLVILLRVIMTKSEERRAKKLGDDYDD